MGKSISYCYKCSSLLREDDFERGKAFQDGDRVVCLRCAPQLQGTRSAPRSSTAIRVAGTRKIPAPPAPATPPAPRSRLPLILAAAGGGVAIVIVMLFFALRESPPPPKQEAPPQPPEARRETKVEKPQPAASTPDQALLREARKFAAEHPDDLAGQLKQLEKVVWEFERSPSAAAAKEDLAAVKAKIAAQVTAGLAALEKEIEEPLKKEAFGAAVKIVEDAASRQPTTEWQLAIAKRSREIFDLARGIHLDLLARVEALAAEGKTREIQEIVKRVRAWGIAVLVEKMDAATAGIVPAKAEETAKLAAPVETKPRSEASKAYLARWEAAMAKAAARDYTAAIDELSRAASAAKEPEVAAESKEDLEDARRLQALLKSTLDGVVAKPPPVMSVELRDGRKAAGRVLQATPERVEIGSKKSIFAEWSEVTAGSIAALPRKEAAEPRLLALLCLIEGEAEAAKSVAGPAADSVPAKYWIWAPGAKAKLPKADPQEAAAREVFYAAEQEYRAMKTRGLAADKYRSLRKDFLATAVVRSAIDRIERRSDAGRDYYFAPADLERAGTLKPLKSGRLESNADSDGNFANQNYAEAEFYAMPETPYRAWVLAGGCCQEVFSFLWQGTELTEISPRTKKAGSADVGAALAAYAKFSIRGLKPTHDPKTPKTAARWEWIELPLPKYATAGPKRIRLMTDQKGFGVGAIVVSATRKAPPKEDELKELDKARAAETPAIQVDPDLVAWWALDEGAGGVSEDLSGNGHPATLSGGIKWRDGKIGGGLEFDGGTSEVTVADAPDLRITGDITIAFWVIKKSPAGDWQRLVGKGDTHRRTFGVWTGGNADKILWQQYGENDLAVLQVTGSRDLPLGQWTHVAVTVKGTQAIIYFNGAKDAEGARSGPPLTGADPVTLGSSFHAPLAGSLDDVRIYKRALGPEEIRELFDLGR